MNDAVTRERVLAAAETLLIEHGITALSVRSITTRGGVGGSAVASQFGSKFLLLRSLLDRLLAPVSEQRLARLHALPDDAPVRDVVAAFVEPLQAMPPARRTALLTLVHHFLLQNPPMLPVLVKESLGGSVEAFEAALARATPEVPRELVHVRVSLALGTLSIAEFGRPDVAPVEVRDDLIAFLTGAFSAPPH